MADLRNRYGDERVFYGFSLFPAGDLFAENLANFSGLKLSGTQVSDAELKALKDLTGHRQLYLEIRTVTDTEFARFRTVLLLAGIIR